MKRKSDLSIVICAYNAVDYTKLLVGSIRRHSKYEHEIVLYSDGSTDGTKAWVSTQDDIKWQHDRKNRGICTAMNRAARMARREYLFFPNTDHVVAPGWDEALLSRLDPRTVVSCQCIEPGIVPVAPIFHARNCGIRWEEFDEPAFVRAAAELSSARVVPGINYPFALSRSLWDELCGLDERFNPGPANDPDFFYRLSFAGARMIRAEDALVYHFSGKSSRMADEARTERREWHEVTERNEARFVEKWGERYRYANGGLPDPGPEARKRVKREAAEPAAPLTVVIDTSSVTSKRQGIGVYTENLMKALSRLDGVRVLPFSGAEIRGDVFHGPAFAIPPGTTIPAVATFHDLAFMAHPEWYPPEFVKHLSGKVEDAARRCSRIIAVSEHTKREVGRLLKVPENNVDVVHEALPEAFQRPLPSPSNDAARRLAKDRRYVLSIGVQQKRKNAVGLVQAFSRLKLKGRAEILILVGGSDCEEPRLRAEISRLGLEDSVTLTGYLPQEDLLGLYAGAAAFVYPSFEEGFGLPILEAMACGAPVIASNRGAIPEVAGDAAILVDPEAVEDIASAIDRILADGDLAGELADRGKKRVGQFSWDRAARETVAVYRKARATPVISVAASPRAKYRIAVDARMMPASTTGTGRYSREILRHLASREAEFVFVGPEKLDESFANQPSVLQHHPAGMETLLDPVWEQFSLPTFFMGCDAYFSPTGILPVARSCPAVPVIHDLGFEDHPDHFEPVLRAHLARWIRNACTSADRIIAVSEFTSGRIRERYGVPQNKIRVVHHGRGPGEAASLPRRDAILSVSSFEPNKNHELLVRAFAGVADSWKGELILAGRKGRSLDAVRSLVRSLKLERRVRIETEASDSDLLRLYREAYVFAFPSTYEGFGMPLVEAMQAGLPVVANDAASIPEVLDGAGLLVKEATVEAWIAALKGVLRDRKLASSLAEKSISRAEAFDWQRAADETWRVLVECVEAR